MRLHLSSSLVALLTVAAGSARATEYYVATTGSDSAAGTMAAPWATLQKAATTAAAGDTVWIHGGTYKITTPASSSAGVNFTKSGTSDTNRIKYWAVPGELPVIRLLGTRHLDHRLHDGVQRHRQLPALQGAGDLQRPDEHVLEQRRVGRRQRRVRHLRVAQHAPQQRQRDFIGNKSGGGHLVLNCDAHDNYDPNSNQGMGQNADGFGVHYQTSGATTIIRGCRAWWNSDDGYDLINQEVPVTVESSWAMGNGYANYGATNPTDGNGNGFKMGSSKTGVRHLVQGNVAWKNKASGFYANHSTGGNTWYNNTSFQNGTQYNMLASPADMPDVTITLSGALAHVMRNNIGFPNQNSNMTGVDTMFNAWDLGLTPANADFTSVSDPSVSGTGMSIESSGALGPRAADGTMPKIDFLKLAMGSKFIDKGTDVGLPFVGTAPDLGAYEYGATTTSGSGGATGTGGSAAGGRGGATGSGGTTGAGGRGGTTGTGGSAVVGTGGSGQAGTGGSLATGTGGASATTGTGGASATTGTGGAGATGTGGATTTGAAGTGTTTGTGGAGPGETPGANGCSCAVESPAGRASLLTLISALSALIVARRRQTRSQK